MRIIKGLILFSLIFIYIICVAVAHILITLIRPSLRYHLISRLTKILSLSIKKILGIRLRVEGNAEYLLENGNFFISNHVGYLDGIILSSLFPAIFVSKLQVKSWPFFGWMSEISGTIFIDRERKLKTACSVEKITSMLRKKINVLLFPEGTSTDASKILPFQSVFFQAPLNSKSCIIPLTVQYLRLDSNDFGPQNRDSVCWYGQSNFFQHLCKVLALKTIEAKVIIHPKICTDNYSGNPDYRKHLAEFARGVILQDFNPVK